MNQDILDPISHHLIAPCDEIKNINSICEFFFFTNDRPNTRTETAPPTQLRLLYTRPSYFEIEISMFTSRIVSCFSIPLLRLRAQNMRGQDIKPCSNPVKNYYSEKVEKRGTLLWRRIFSFGYKFADK